MCACVCTRRFVRRLIYRTLGMRTLFEIWDILVDPRVWLLKLLTLQREPHLVLGWWTEFDLGAVQGIGRGLALSSDDECFNKVLGSVWWMSSQGLKYKSVSENFIYWTCISKSTLTEHKPFSHLLFWGRANFKLHTGDAHWLAKDTHFLLAGHNKMRVFIGRENWSLLGAFSHMMSLKIRGT